MKTDSEFGLRHWEPSEISLLNNMEVLPSEMWTPQSHREHHRDEKHKATGKGGLGL